MFQTTAQATTARKADSAYAGRRYTTELGAVLTFHTLALKLYRNMPRGFETVWLHNGNTFTRALVSKTDSAAPAKLLNAYDEPQGWASATPTTEGN